MTIIVTLDSIFLTHISHVIFKSLTLVALFRVVSLCAGPEGIPPELFTHGGHTVAKHLHRIFVEIWIDEMIPADMRNANIITIFKKNDRCQ